MYYFSLVIDRLPGKQFLLWGLFLALFQVLKMRNAPDIWFALLVWPYLGFCIYSWLAGWLVNLWIRFFPAK